ncbi:hypothetical protein MSIMFB_04379 [Mycobacterium simulans]|uniref:Uncharacterized protein n=1 Tax=Mycobacterium simulans TaxID=627089 RepID=A0A7Z7NCC7_9MYCO|nr:hypothetical protein [Mycobacterium simulans]SOJ56902.1 hypothetical protein MSIMFB_04379 [Mycobacterium simulans]
MAGSTPLPTLSQIQTMDITYLREAAHYWTHTANLWEQVFSEIHDRVSTPGGTPWKGQAATRAQERSYRDMVEIRGAAYQLHEAAAVARRATEHLEACRAGVLEAVADTHADGFDVGDDYSVSDRVRGGSAEFRAARRAQAQAHAAFIRHRVAALVAKDQEISTRIAATTSGIGNLTFQDAPGIDDDAGGDEHRGVQLVDNHTFKDAPHPKPVPPPGGWSSDPLMRAAQKIAYGHASGPDGHMGDFPGMTKDQLAELIYGKLKRSIENPEGLRLGVTNSDGAPVIYDPKDNVLIVRDPRGADCGTVFKPDLAKDPNYVSRKFGWNEPSFKPDQLTDGPLPAAAEPRPVPSRVGGEPVQAEPPVGAPVEAPPGKPALGIGEGGGPMPRMPLGTGTPWDAPSTGPHPVHPHKPGQHHRLPLLGELPDDYED